MKAILTEIMYNRFSAIVEEASAVAYRTAHTTFVKQTQDFQVALVSPRGETFICPKLTGTAQYSSHTLPGFVGHFNPAELQPGDVLITNDPYSTGGHVTHIMDLTLARPIFFEGKLVAFADGFVHASDVGGAVPGSISPNLTEVFQEGLRIRPMKLISGGCPNHDLINILRDNSRIGDAIFGDLQAMMSAMRLMDLRINELCAKLGLAAVEQGIEDVLAYGERKARAILRSLKNGTYEFGDYVEGLTDEPVFLHCSLTIEDDEATIDFSGSSPQVEAAFNFIAGDRTSDSLCLALVLYFQTVEPSIPNNAGMQRPLRTLVPKGTVLNAEFPAASGNRWVVIMRAFDVVIGCLNQVVKGGIMACGAGQAGIISASWRSEATGASRISVVEPFSGGSGGRARVDGVDGNDMLIASLLSTPIEYAEAETPLAIRRYELVGDSQGHGQFRGGTAIRIELECRALQVVITARGLDRFRFQPWGVSGGLAGQCGKITLLRKDGEVKDIGRIVVLTLQAGDRLVMESPSGGGFGDPRLREPSRVLRDVVNGLISPETAREVYGVVIADSVVDEKLTRERRAAMRPKSDSQPDLGTERRRLEAVWPLAANAAFATALLSVPIAVRPAIAERSRRDLENTKAAVSPAAATAAIEKHYSSLRLK